MEYTYKAIFNYEGISHPSNKPALTIYQSDTISVTITSKENLDDICQDIDRKGAYGNVILRALHREGREEELRNELPKIISEIQTERAKTYTTGDCLIIEIIGETEITLNEKYHTEIDGIHIYFDALNREEIQSKHKKTIDSTLASVSLALDSRERIHKVADGIHCLHVDGKPIMSFTMTAGRANVILSRNIDDKTTNLMSQLITSSISDKNLQSSFRLYNRSLNKNESRFKAFMNSWMALEIFTVKMFSEFESIYATSLEKNHETKALGSFLQRTKEVMKGKYRIADKFTLIAAFVSDSTDDDIATFKRIKRTRDDISHGVEVNDDDLPLEELRQLTGNTLKNYLLKRGD